MTTPLKILYMTAELAPLVSTGGLGEVARALPRALQAQGHDVRIALPCYRRVRPPYRGHQFCVCTGFVGGRAVHGALRIARTPDSGIPLYLVEHNGYFDREHPYGPGGYEYDDALERFAFFTQAALHGMLQTGWAPDIIHCNDWHTALAPAYLKAGWPTADWRSLPTLFTIHNLAYQGDYPEERFEQTGLSAQWFTPEGLGLRGRVNTMSAALRLATKLNTVSPRYAREIQTPQFGCGLETMLKTRAKDLAGILNGVDYTLWNPSFDHCIARPYTAEDLAGKAACKEALQHMAGFQKRKAPLFIMVSRLEEQKGVDLLIRALDSMLRQDIQLVVLGRGNGDLAEACAKTASLYPQKMCFFDRYDPALSHAMYAGADFMLMPSRFEPCGLGQLYALAYGAVPIVRRTGGLADTVRHLTTANLARGRATGIVFGPANPTAIIRAVTRALAVYEDRPMLHDVRVAGMKEDFSWERSARAYERLYRKAIGSP